MTLTIELTREQEQAALDAAKQAGYEEATPEKYLLARFSSVLDDYVRQVLTREVISVTARYIAATATERAAVIACLPPLPPVDPAVLEGGGASLPKP